MGFRSEFERRRAAATVSAATGLTQFDIGATEAELDYLDITAAGTAQASKAVVLDASKGISTITSATITTLTGTTANVPTVNATNVDAGASGTAGSVDVFPATAASGKATITCADQAANHAVIIDVASCAATRTITLRDPGAAASFLTTTDGTAAATAATAAEITRACDVSARIVSLAAGTLGVTEATHDGKVIVLNHTGASSTATLPAATGSGARITFIVGTVNTSSHIITVTGDDTLKGSLNILDADSTAQTAYALSGTDDTITLNGTTTGGQVGDWIECVDIAADVWAVRGMLLVPAGSNIADPTSGS